MGVLDVRFHGICTHVIHVDPVTHTKVDRVVLLECGTFDPVPHRALISVPEGTAVPPVGPACDCIERVIIPSSGTDMHYRLSGVHLTMEGATGVLDPLFWTCGVPSLTQLEQALGPLDSSKVSGVPAGVSAWFDVGSGELLPYLSLKEAVAVRLTVKFAQELPVIRASCWKCTDNTWTFTMQEGAIVRVSNECGTAGAPTDFLLHYQIAEHPPDNPPVLPAPPHCLFPPPSWADAPPGSHNASLGCSNSAYP